jgi:hypothetical protein
MRRHPWLAIPLLGLLLAGGAGARQWVQAPVPVPGCESVSDAELGCGYGACAGYGTAVDWADEVQVRFRVPHPDRGGPWLIEYVAVFMSGSGDHRVIVRDPGTTPGSILYDSVTFTPASSSWPPADWTFVPFHTSPPYPGYLTADENGPIMLGTALLPGDAIGLVSTTGDGDGWGHYQDQWDDDTANSSVTPAIRIGLSDLGLSGTDISTWSSVKALFR